MSGGLLSEVRVVDRYGGAVLIAVLLFDESTVAKLAARAISPEEVRQVNDGDRVVTPATRTHEPKAPC